MPAPIPRFALLLAICGLGVVARGASGPVIERSGRESLFEERKGLFETMRTELSLTEGQLAAVRAIFAGSTVLGQGNPAMTVHPMTREECRTIRATSLVAQPNPARRGAANMVPTYDPEAGEAEADARACIDQHEFPDVACEYPIVHVTAREAVLLCEAIGKRICDAHEWEGACAGDVRDANREYAWGAFSRRDASAAQREPRARLGVWTDQGPFEVCDRQPSAAPKAPASRVRRAPAGATCFVAPTRIPRALFPLA